ncbi:MAG: FAD-dependent monooxygenase [Hyphomonadaceae bacterium]|nr:FAD-dependent monooxygenase [Hyphomonadaceae bacterium]MBC6411646.1 FAD-dependent monooxygenase [Hyphomonadaceae bacterium]
MTRILVAGAGIGGLTAALCLKQTGFDVTVFERAASLSGAGVGIQLGPNALHVLDALCLRADLDVCAVTPEAVSLRNYRTGKPHLQVPLGERFRARYGNGYVHIHRADLQKILYRAARRNGIRVKTGHTVTGVSPCETCIRVMTSRGDFDGDILIAADGIRSTLRRILFGNLQAEFSGCIAWRALIDPLKLDVPVAKQIHGWIGPRRHVVAYYVRGGALINLVAVEDDQKWAGESWMEPGDKSELLQHFSGWNTHVISLLSACEDVYKWGLFDRNPLSDWTDGRVTVLGDAAHPMLPFMAQGAAMAIEDGWVLAHCLCRYPVTQALQNYERFRKPRTSHLQAISRQNAKLYHAQGAARTWRNFKLAIGHAIQPLQDMQLDLIYGTNVARDYPLEFA